MANTLKFGNGQWATGNGTALAYNDENANYKPLPFDFTRASSGTVVNQSGLIETVGSGIPRIDFQGNTKGALLLEPSRTNSIAYSNDLNASGWNTFSTDGGTVTRTSNYGISPSGKQDSTRVVFTTQFVSLYYSFSGISGDASATMYVKGVAGEVIAFGFGSDVSFGQEFTLNGQWQRIEFNATSTNTTLNINSWGSTRDASDIEVYGVQLEAGSYATSYIPTSGSAVTRVAETNRQTPPSGVIGQTEGTMFVDCKVNAQGTYTGFSLNDNTTNNEVIIRFTTQDRIEYYLRSGGSQPIGGGTTLFDTDKRVKIAFAYKSGDSSVYINGAQVTTSTTTTMPVNLSIIKFARGNSTADFSGKTNDFKVYNTRLSNAELAALTQV